MPKAKVDASALDGSKFCTFCFGVTEGGRMFHAVDCDKRPGRLYAGDGKGNFIDDKIEESERELEASFEDHILEMDLGGW